MAELADALDSGSSESNFMEVQVLLPAPFRVEITDFCYLYSFLLIWWEELRGVALKAAIVLLVTCGIAN